MEPFLASQVISVASILNLIYPNVKDDDIANAAASAAHAPVPACINPKVFEAYEDYVRFDLNHGPALQSAGKKGKFHGDF